MNTNRGKANTDHYSWVCTWRTQRWKSSTPLSAALLEILQNSPSLRLDLSNCQVYNLPSEKFLESIPAQKLGSLELAISHGEVSNKLRRFLVSATNLQTLRIATDATFTSAFNFGTRGGKLPAVKALYLEKHNWRLYGTDYTQVWDFSKLQHLTMDEVSLPDFLHCVAGMQFPQLRTLVVRDHSTRPSTIVTICGALRTFISTTVFLQELEIFYQSSSLFHRIPGSGDSGGDSKGDKRRVILRPLGRFHAIRGVDGVANILDALLAAGL